MHRRPSPGHARRAVFSCRWACGCARCSWTRCRERGCCLSALQGCPTVALLRAGPAAPDRQPPDRGRARRTWAATSATTRCTLPAWAAGGPPLLSRPVQHITPAHSWTSAGAPPAAPVLPGGPAARVPPARALTCRVIAWEPVPQFRDFLELSIALNNVTALITVRCHLRVKGFRVQVYRTCMRTACPTVLVIQPLLLCTGRMAAPDLPSCKNARKGWQPHTVRSATRPACTLSVPHAWPALHAPGSPLQAVGPTLLACRPHVVADRPGERFELTVPQRGVWGTASVNAGNIDRCCWPLAVPPACGGMGAGCAAQRCPAMACHAAPVSALEDCAWLGVFQAVVSHPSSADPGPLNLILPPQPDPRVSQASKAGK